MKNKEILIGSRIKITDSTNKELVGTRGKIIELTKNTFVIKTSKGMKKLMKKQIKMNRLK